MDDSELEAQRLHGQRREKLKPFELFATEKDKEINRLKEQLLGCVTIEHAVKLRREAIEQFKTKYSRIIAVEAVRHAVAFYLAGGDDWREKATQNIQDLIEGTSGESTI